MPLRRPFCLLLIACLAVHAGVLLTAKLRTGRTDGYAFKSVDCGEFYRLGLNLARHGVFSERASAPLQPDTWRTPGYPAFLSVVIGVVGDSPSSLVIVQQVLSIFNVVLLFLIARTWMSERRAAFAAGLFLLEPYHLFYSLWLMSTTLFVTALLLLWLVWQRLLSRPRPAWATVLGVLTGLAILIRPVAVLVPFAIIGGLLFSVLKKHRLESTPSRFRVSWLTVTVFAASCFAPVCGWMLRNQAVAGHFALSDQGGVVLAYFKSTEVELWRQGRTRDRIVETSLDPDRLGDPHPVWEAIDEQLRASLSTLSDEQRSSLSWQRLAQGNRSRVDSFVVSGALSEIGRRRLIADPLSTVACYLVRCGSILTFPLSLAIDPPTGVESAPLTALAKGCLYLILCGFVAWKLLTGRLSFAQAFFPLACAIALLLATTPQIDPRFRVPIIPLLVFLAMLPRKAEATIPPAGVTT